VIHLDGDRIGNDERAPQAAHESGCQPVGPVPSVDRGNDRRRVGDDRYRLTVSSRKSSSTRWLRSDGPSPEPT
jgi:hypothetical protein